MTELADSTTKNTMHANGHFGGVDNWGLDVGRSSVNSTQTSAQGLGIGPNGVGLNNRSSIQSSTGAERSSSQSVLMTDHGMEFGARSEHTSRGGTKKSASINGGVTFNKPTPREINANSSGLDATIRELSGGDTTATGRTSGAKLAAEVGIGKGAFGLSANAHAATESGVHFHTNQPGIDADNIEGLRSNRVPDSPSLGGLNLTELKSGEGYSMQHTGSTGAGMGAIVYGVGAGGSISNTDVQQTVIHRNDEGYLVDVQTMDAKTAAGNVNVGDGALEVGGSSMQGSSSRVRFQSNEDAMMAFQKTGILPGAIESLDADDKLSLIHI